MKYAFFDINMKKGWFSIALFGALAALVLLICYALSRQTTSPLVSVTQGFADLFEGFVSTTSPQCPKAVVDVYGNQVVPPYKFYTDATGESLCCAGTINPLAHTCTIPDSKLTGAYTSQPKMILGWHTRIDYDTMPASAKPLIERFKQNKDVASAQALCSALPNCTAVAHWADHYSNTRNDAIFYNSPTSSPIQNNFNGGAFTLYVRPSPLEGQGMCAFRPGVPDPRPGKKSNTLPLCTSVADNAVAFSGGNVCPPSLPKYGASTTQQSCCKTATNIDGTDCITTDLQNGSFCRVNAKNGEPDCAAMRSYEKAVCPPSLQKISYQLGSAESKAYPAANGLRAPLCFGIQGSCFPDETVLDLQSKNVFTREPNPNNTSKRWKYACGGYTQLMRGDPANVQMTYITP